MNSGGNNCDIVFLSVNIVLDKHMVKKIPRTYQRTASFAKMIQGSFLIKNPANILDAIEVNTM